MRRSIVVRLTRAEVALTRTPFLAYSSVALLATILLLAGQDPIKGMGASLLMCAAIGLCFHLPILAVQDAVRGTRALTLTMPVLPAEYAAAKLSAALLHCSGPLVAAAILYQGSSWVREFVRGEILLAVAVMWLAAVVQSVGVALLSGSMGLTMSILGVEMFLLGNGGALLPVELRSRVWLWFSDASGSLLAVCGPMALVASLILLTLFGFARRRSYVSRVG